MVVRKSRYAGCPLAASIGVAVKKMNRSNVFSKVGLCRCGAMSVSWSAHAIRTSA